MRAGAAGVHFLIFALGVFAPFLTEQIRSQGMPASYSFLQITNVFWTLNGDRQICDPVRPDNLGGGRCCVAAIVFLANLPGVVRELRQVRIEPPRRVLEEDAALAAAKSPPKPVHTNPWD